MLQIFCSFQPAAEGFGTAEPWLSRHPVYRLQLLARYTGLWNRCHLTSHSDRLVDAVGRDSQAFFFLLGFGSSSAERIGKTMSSCC